MIFALLLAEQTESKSGGKPDHPVWFDDQHSFLVKIPKMQFESFKSILNSKFGEKLTKGVKVHL